MNGVIYDPDFIPLIWFRSCAKGLQLLLRIEHIKQDHMHFSAFSFVPPVYPSNCRVSEYCCIILTLTNKIKGGILIQITHL